MGYAWKKGEDLNAGKNLQFTGNNGEVILHDSIDQGAGYLQFLTTTQLHP